MKRKQRIVASVMAGLLLGGLLLALLFLKGSESEGGVGFVWRAKWRVYHYTGISLGVRHSSPHGSCIANLKQIDGAKATWALQRKKGNTDVPTATDLFGATAYIRDVLVCPRGGSYLLRSVAERPSCSNPSHDL